MTSREVGEALRLDDKTVLKWAREGRIPSVRMSARAIRFDLARVIAALGGSS